MKKIFFIVDLILNMAYAAVVNTDYLSSMVSYNQKGNRMISLDL